MADEPVRVPITLLQLAIAVLSLVLAIVLGAVCLISFYLQPIFDKAQRSADLAACNAEANGEVWQAIAATFNTPPTPPDTPPGELTPREKAVKRIQDKAKKFDDCR